MGERFSFEAMLPVNGGEGERIHVFLWRVLGPPAASYAAALRDVRERWMGEDACEHNKLACESLLASMETLNGRQMHWGRLFESVDRFMG